MVRLRFCAIRGQSSRKKYGKVRRESGMSGIKSVKSKSKVVKVSRNGLSVKELISVYRRYEYIQYVYVWNTEDS